MDYVHSAVGAVRGVSGAAILQFVVDGVKCEDEGQMFMVPWHAVSEWAACLDLDGYIEGKVMVAKTSASLIITIIRYSRLRFRLKWEEASQTGMIIRFSEKSEL